MLGLSQAPSEVAEKAIVNRIISYTNPEIVEAYFEDGVGLVKAFFSLGDSSLASYRQGQLFLNLLKRLDVDVDTYMAKESMDLKFGRMPYHLEPLPDRKITFKSLDNDERLLYWIWDLDPSTPGHLLVSQYTGLGPESNWYGVIHQVDSDTYHYWNPTWPFSDADPRLHWREKYVKNTPRETRFVRREAKKARKERARMGQKRSRRMPGAWCW